MLHKKTTSRFPLRHLPTKTCLPAPCRRSSISFKTGSASEFLVWIRLWFWGILGYKQYPHKKFSKRNEGKIDMGEIEWGALCTYQMVHSIASLGLTNAYYSWNLALLVKGQDVPKYPSWHIVDPRSCESSTEAVRLAKERNDGDIETCIHIMYINIDTTYIYIHVTIYVGTENIQQRTSWYYEISGWIVVHVCQFHPSILTHRVQDHTKFPHPSGHTTWRGDAHLISWWISYRFGLVVWDSRDTPT